MLIKALKFTTRILAEAAGEMLFGEIDDNNDQLDNLSDGQGNIIADGNDMTLSEAEDAQARGELYDTYL